MTPIRVAVDGHAIDDGSLGRGIGTYLGNLLPHLATDDRLAVELLAASRPPDDWKVEWRRTSRRRGTGRIGRRVAALEHLVRLPVDLDRTAADVLWGPSNHPPRRWSAPLVQTVHDLTPLVVPHPLHASEAKRWERIGPRLRDAAAIVTGSQASATAIVDRLAVPPSLVHVIPYGVSPHFRPDGPSDSCSPLTILWVGSWGPHKGLAEAVAVLDRLRDLGRDVVLRIVGRQDAWQLQQVRDQVSVSAHPDHIVVSPNVGDLALCYRGATALVATSRAEGFGLPVVEAMACGLPVVSFANTSLTEVVGDGGVLVEDGDVEGFVTALVQLVDDPAAHRAAGERALLRSRSFDWARTAAGHADVLVAAAT